LTRSSLRSTKQPKASARISPSGHLGTAPPKSRFIMTTYYDYDVVVWSMQDVMPEKPNKAMREVAISEFKTKCLSLLKEVSKTRTPLRVTRRGKATADVIPTSFETEQKGWIGSMSDTIEIVGDNVSPIVDSDLSEPLTESQTEFRPGRREIPWFV
jgi:hypothetical protein